MCIKFITRNIIIYFKDKIGIFFSFLGMFISLIIYVFFLRSNLINSLSGITQVNKFVDVWMIAGLISIVSMTSSLNAFGQKIEDQKNKKLNDFQINNNLSMRIINILYVITAIIEGTISTLVFIVICFGYLYFKYKESYFYSAFGLTILYSFLLIVFSSVLFSLITSLLKSSSSFSSLSAIVGTLSGFFSGTYIIYGDLPKFMQRILDIWPGFQIASITRNQMLSSINTKIPESTLGSLGVNLNDTKAVLITICAIILCILIALTFKVLKINK